jgi:hypothetical protein
VGLSDYIGLSCRFGLRVVGLQAEFDAYEQKFYEEEWQHKVLNIGLQART